MLVEHSGNSGDRQSVFHDVEEQVAAAAHAVKVLGSREQFVPAPFVAVADDHAAQRADSIGIWREAAIGDERARIDNRAPRGLAVETDAQDAVRPQQRDQHPPSGVWIGKVVQHADRLDVVEAAAEVLQIENVGVAVFDVAQPRLAGLSARICKTWQADIDGENARLRPLLGDVEGVLAGTAAGDENILRRLRWGAAGGRSRASGGFADEHRERVIGPARKWVLFVLLHHVYRGLVIDRGKSRYR